MRQTFLRTANREELETIKDDGVWGLEAYSGLTTSLRFAVEWGRDRSTKKQTDGLIVLDCHPGEVIPTKEPRFERFSYLFEIAK